MKGKSKDWIEAKLYCGGRVTLSVVSSGGFGAREISVVMGEIFEEKII